MLFQARWPYWAQSWAKQVLFFWHQLGQAFDLDSRTAHFQDGGALCSRSPSSDAREATCGPDCQESIRFVRTFGTGNYLHWIRCWSYRWGGVGTGNWRCNRESWLRIFSILQVSQDFWILGPTCAARLVSLLVVCSWRGTLFRAWRDHLSFNSSCRLLVRSKFLFL